MLLLSRKRDSNLKMSAKGIYTPFDVGLKCWFELRFEMLIEYGFEIRFEMSVWIVGKSWPFNLFEILDSKWV